MRCIWLILCIAVCITIGGCKSISSQTLNQAVESTTSPSNTVIPSPSSSPGASPIASATQAVITSEDGSSNKFTKQEIKSAMDCALEKFKDFKGCTLTKIWYDESKSNTFIDGYMATGKGSINGVNKENVIVLLSNFSVDESGADDGFNPNSTYTDWNWIVIRNSKTGAWVVDDWGY